MKKFVVIAVLAFVVAPALAAAAFVVAAPALAAELRPVPGTEYYGYYKGTPRPLAVSWTGCYLGGHVGGAISNYDVTDSPFVVPVTIPTGFPPVPPVPIDLGAVKLSSGSGVVGGQAGCNLDLGYKWLVGVEVDAAWTRITNSKLFSSSTTVSGSSMCNSATPPVCTTPGVIVTENATPTARTDFIATATARLGYELGYYNQGLVYGKGGVAWVADQNAFGGNVSTTACNDVSGSSPTGCLGSTVKTFNFVSGRQYPFGWTIGAGIEWAVFGGWSVKGEYDYMSFGHQNVTLTDPVFGPLSRSIKQEISEFKIGINYLFGRSTNDLPAMY
jgi:opacity protein-like surface antigen